MDQVNIIREKIDIVSFISDYIPVKKAGRNFQALCPFHGEKSPSFMISPERQRWHCFGCGKDGDAYTFLMEYEHLEFPEALRFLAKQTGVELVSTGYADTASSAKKERLYRVNNLAAEFYHYILMNHAAGKIAREYLNGRGINDKLIQTFKLGYAPVSGKALIRYLFQKKQYEKEDIVDAGLANAYSNGISDFFRGRLIFPLIDHRDNVVGFSGRILDEKNAVGGKYINTRDTLIYHKREQFFGINITKEAIRKANQAILVEGEFDVMSCFQNGISNVLAVKGTALTDQQVALLSRYAQKVSICFDGDAAGQEAIKRSLPILAKKKLNTTVILIPNGKDPDEALKTHPGEFKKAVNEDKNVYDYLFDQAVQKYPSTTPEGKQKIADELLPMISDIENAIIKEHYLRKLSSSIQTTYDSILQEMEKRKRKVPAEVLETIQKVKRSREETLEQYLLALVLQNHNPKKIVSAVWQIIKPYTGNERADQKLMKFTGDFLEETGMYEELAFNNSLPTELLNAYNTAMLYPLPTFTNEEKHIEEAEKVAGQLKAVYIKEKIKQLAEQIKQKEQDGSEEETNQLKELYSQYVTSLKNL